MSISKFIASAIALTIIVIMAVQAILTVSAYATPGHQYGNHKVIICHATDSHSNPYTDNDVDKSSIDEVNNKYLNGHGDHTGPVWYKGIADHSWGDIIPPFTNDAGNSYLGQNWNDAGKAIYENDCKFKAVTTQPENPGTVEGGGNGGGQVLGASTTSSANSATLANTGTPLLMNFTVGTMLLGAVAATFRRNPILKFLNR